MDGLRWRNTPRLAAYAAAIGAGERPAREAEQLSDESCCASGSCSGSGSTSLCGWRTSCRRSTRPRSGNARALGGGRLHAASDAARTAAGRWPTAELPTLIRSATGADAAAGDPPPRGRGVRGHRPAGGFQGARRARWTGRFRVDGSRRAGRAGAARAAHAPPHVGRAGAHRPRVPVLRRPPTGAARAAAGGVSAAGRGAQRAGDGAAVDDGHALGADATARAGVGARGGPRPCATWRCCCCSRTSS